MARDILGGNGILLDFHVMRHMCDMEALLTYEGTAEIQTLLVGRDITGQSASTCSDSFTRSRRPPRVACAAPPERRGAPRTIWGLAPSGRSDAQCAADCGAPD